MSYFFKIYHKKLEEQKITGLIRAASRAADLQDLLFLSPRLCFVLSRVVLWDGRAIHQRKISADYFHIF